MKAPLEFDDTGANDDELAKGVMVGNIRAWHDRIEALEAALRFILTDPPAALDEPDTDAEVIQHYREVARAALDKDAGE